ncbi:hypothetical protein EV175_005456 [Coemansia sp. RSA 1933]|nr:hypothetical protein EV175_005456 [Coemansia sp. RSA 1933]
MILEGISRLGIDSKGKTIVDNIAVRSDNENASSSYGSDKTIALVPLKEDRESDICEQLFNPVESVPKLAALRKALLKDPAVRIPIHQDVYNRMKEDIDVSKLERYFSIVENVGSVILQLTPRVETALLVNNVNVSPESMQQNYIMMDVMVDRNAAELSMTLPQIRPDYLLIFNGGNIRQIALELTEKMTSDAVGKNGKLEYLLGYTTAGSRVLFECIYEGNQMVECTDTTNLTKVADRITMLVVLINVIRVAQALYFARGK